MHGQAHGGMYADGIWEAIGLLDEMDEQMDRTGPLLIGRDFAPDSAWGLFFQNNVRMYAPGIFAVRYLSPVFCDILRVYLKGKAYTVNPEEPLERESLRWSLSKKLRAPMGSCCPSLRGT